MMSNYMRNKNEYTNFRNQEKLRQQNAERFSKYARLVVHTTKKKLFHN